MLELKDIMETYKLSKKNIADHFEIPLRTIQSWYSGERQAPDYIPKMMIKILESEKKAKEEKKMMMVQFEAGFDTNYLKGESKDLSIYAECKIPEDASDDYGYITMKDAILKELTEDEKKVVTFWYDGQEKYLAEDAKENCDVYIDIER